MKTVVATDGSLTSEAVLPYVVPLAGSDPVIILTVVEVPRTLLSNLRRVYGESSPELVGTDAEYVGASAREGAAVGWPGDDAILDRYLDDQGEERAGALAAALTEAGLSVTVDVREGEDAAAGVLEALEGHRPDVVVAAATGRGLLGGLLGSTSTKLTRMSPCPVLLLRGR